MHSDCPQRNIILTNTAPNLHEIEHLMKRPTTGLYVILLSR